MNNKFISWAIGIVAVLGLVISIVAVGGNSQSTSTFGAVGTRFPHGLTVGSSGTNLSKLLTGRVNCAAGSATVAASNIGTYDCAVTGVASGDTIVASLGNPVANINIAGVYASTTNAGYFELVLSNSSTTAIAVGTATTSVSYTVSTSQ